MRLSNSSNTRQQSCAEILMLKHTWQALLYLAGDHCCTSQAAIDVPGRRPLLYLAGSQDLNAGGSPPTRPASRLRQTNVAFQMHRTPPAQAALTRIVGIATRRVREEHWLVIVIVSYISLSSKPARKETTKRYIVLHAQQNIKS